MTMQPPGFGYPAPVPPQARGGGAAKYIWGGLAVFLVSLLVGGGLAWSGWKPGGDRNIAEMSYISADDPGPSPFTDSVASVDRDDIVPVARETYAGGVEGGTEQLYGGSGSRAVCDAEGLIRNLKGMPDRRSAFAGALGLSNGQVDSYIRSLKPVVLMHDTWVTNHSYSNGRALPFQATLQAGTAVLVDAYGVPRVKCDCGNPLAQRWSGYVVPSSVKPWPGYDPRRVIYIYAPEYHRTTINVTNIYNEGDDYDITINENEIVEPDSPELATTPADMNVRPNEDLLDEEGAEAARRDEWDLDEGETGTRPAEGKDDEADGTSGGSSAKSKSVGQDEDGDEDDEGKDQKKGFSDIDDATVSLPSTSSSSFDEDTSSFLEGKAVTLSVRGRDEDGDTASGKCDIDVEIKNSSGEKVDSEKKKGASCAQTFSFTGLKEGSYTAKVTVAAKTGKGKATDTVSFKVVDELDSTSSSSTSSSKSSTSKSTTSERSSTSSSSPTRTTNTPATSEPTVPSAPTTVDSGTAPATGADTGAGTDAGATDYTTGDGTAGDAY